MSSRTKASAGKVTSRARVSSRSTSSGSSSTSRGPQWSSYGNLFTEEELAFLAKLPWLKVTSINEIFEIKQTIDKIGSQATMEFLSTVKSASDLVWNNPTLRSVKGRAEMVEETLKNKPPKVEEGLFVCPRETCRSTKTMSTQIQMRSADEPANTVAVCLVCNKRWVVN